MSGTCFISDLHLDPARPGVTRALAAFLQAHPDYDRLYILGDLFEAWPGDDDDSALGREVCMLLHSYGRQGTSVYIMHGNRDFLLGDGFCKRAGVTLLQDPTVIDLYGQPTLLMHGDSLCTADIDYQAFRRKARDPNWQAELLSKPLQERRDLAVGLRAASREANSRKPEDIMDVTPEAVSQTMASHGVKQLIHGHTHRPARHESPDGLRWVLGDWDSSGWFLEAREDGLHLINFLI